MRRLIFINYLCGFIRVLFVTIVLPIILAVVIKVYLVGLYRISSSSMESTLFSGDIIVVSKINYGVRILNIRMLFKENKIEYKRICGFGKIKKGDVLAFNWPKYYTLNGSIQNFFGDCIIKRCYCLPGDTVIISKKDEEFRGKENLFPFDSSLNWTIYQYGPLFVPGKGKTIKLNPENMLYYKDIICYEKYKDKSLEDSNFKKVEYGNNFKFKNNYYFVLGDNFCNSIDSRYWGFVPEDNIIGKVTLVLFSIDKRKSGFKKIRWDRCLKKV